MLRRALAGDRHAYFAPYSGESAALAATVVAALLNAADPILEALVGFTAAVMAYSIVKYAVRFRAIMAHGADALEPDGTTLRPEYRLLG